MDQNQLCRRIRSLLQTLQALALPPLPFGGTSQWTKCGESAIQGFPTAVGANGRDRGPCSWSGTKPRHIQWQVQNGPALGDVPRPYRSDNVRPQPDGQVSSPAR